MSRHPTFSGLPEGQGEDGRAGQEEEGEEGGSGLQLVSRGF